MKDLKEKDFEKEVLESDIPVVIDLWAEWCGPCRKLTPVLEEISEDFKDKVKFVKVNVDHCKEVVRKYGIRGIPTMLFIKGGEVQRMMVGINPKDQIVKVIKDELL